jgi:MiaB-like tRNA modifying enzyme
MMKIFLDSYGCTLNQADAAIIRGLLKKHEFVELPEARAVILNTCAVKSPTESKMISRVEEYLALGKRVIVTGCLPRMNLPLLERYPVSIVDSNSLDRIDKALESKRRVRIFSDKHAQKLKLPHFQDGSVTGIVEICEGCLSACSFCGTKRARGTLTSYSERDILNYAERLLKSGKKEILLTAQDTGCYGLDTGTDLASLLEKIAALPYDFRLRVGMMNPDRAKKMAGRLLKLFESPKFYRFLHVPVQSGSDRVLKAMSRSYSVRDFVSLVQRFRKEIPDLCLSTDIIVGYPTETGADFAKTLALMKKVKPDVINLSKFCSRPGTRAAELRPLKSQAVKARSEKASEFCWDIIKSCNKPYVGRVLRCLVTGVSAHGETLARAPNYKQVILRRKARPGSFLDVKITGYGRVHLKGEAINRG